MTFILDKFKSIVDKIISDKDTLDFFAVIKRFDIEDKWDVVLSAEWIKQSNNQEDLVYIIELLKNEYDDKIDFVSRLLTFSPDEKFITDIAESVTRNNLNEGYRGEIVVSEDLIISEINIIRLDKVKYQGIKTSVSAKVDSLDEMIFE